MVQWREHLPPTNVAQVWLPARCHMWVEFVVGSRPCSKRFFSSRYSSFLLSSKTNISKFQFDPEPEGHRFVSPRLLGVTLIKQHWFIYFFIIYLFIYWDHMQLCNNLTNIIPYSSSAMWDIKSISTLLNFIITLRPPLIELEGPLPPRQGPKLRPAGRQCDWKLSVGDQNFKASRQEATNFQRLVNVLNCRSRN